MEITEQRTMIAFDRKYFAKTFNFCCRQNIGIEFSDDLSLGQYYAIEKDIQKTLVVLEIEMGDFMRLYEYFSLVNIKIYCRERNISQYYIENKNIDALDYFIHSDVAGKSWAKPSTLLVYACQKIHADVVRYLLQMGADPRVHFYQPIECAARYGSSEVLDILLDHVQKKDMIPSILQDRCDFFLFDAIHSGDTKMIELLEEYGADFDGHRNEMLSDCISQTNDVDLAKYLIKRGAKYTTDSLYESVSCIICHDHTDMLDFVLDDMFELDHKKLCLIIQETVEKHRVSLSMVERLVELGLLNNQT